MKSETGREQSIRAFIAVPLPAEIREAAARVMEGLKVQGAEVKWVTPENFHFTLKFLGEVPASKIASITDSIASALEGVSSFQVILHGAGAFPKLDRPQVIWIGTRGGEEYFRTLAAKIEDAMETLDFPRERRPFSAHLTVGRIRSQKGIGDLVSRIRAAQNQEVGSFNAEKVLLMQSDLKPTGAVYTPIKEFSLG